ncbi:MAG: hypothetical protein ACI3ZC_08235 [Candidatus Cryptobacteroides sp.]
MKEKELYDDELLESLVEDIRFFADGLESPEEGAAYSVKKVKDAITGGVRLKPVWDAALKGHSLEFAVRNWHIYLFLCEGFLQVGWETIPLPTFETAVATLNYLERILPEYIQHRREKAKLEKDRVKKLNVVCETIVMPVLGPLAEKASMTCRVRARNDSVSIVLKDRKGKSRSFRIGFERPIQESLDPAKEYLQSMAQKRAGELSPTPCG